MAIVDKGIITITGKELTARNKRSALYQNAGFRLSLFIIFPSN